MDDPQARLITAESEDVILLTKDVSSLSSFGIVSHCMHLLDTHFRLFVSIWLLVILPTMIPYKELWVHMKDRNNPISEQVKMGNFTEAAAPIAIWNSTAVVSHERSDSAVVASTTQLSNGTGGADQNRTLDNQEEVISWKSLDMTPATVERGLNWKRQLYADPLAEARRLLTVTGGTLWSTVPIAIRRSFIAYTAGKIQVGKRTTIVDAGRAFRVLWKRVLWTHMCIEIVDLARTVIMYSPTLLFDKDKHGGSNLLYWLTSITTWLGLAFYVYTGFAFQLATFVPVLHQDCGSKALGRSWRLLQGKMRVSIGIAVFSMLVLCVATLVGGLAAGVVVVVLGLSRGDMLKDVQKTLASRNFHFSGAIIIGVTSSVHAFFSDMVYAIFCMSCMAFHQESIVKSSFFQNLTKTGRDHDC